MALTILFNCVHFRKKYTFGLLHEVDFSWVKIVTGNYMFFGLLGTGIVRAMFDIREELEAFAGQSLIHHLK